MERLLYIIKSCRVLIESRANKLSSHRPSAKRMKKERKFTFFLQTEMYSHDVHC